jgi:hypothetical protein
MKQASLNMSVAFQPKPESIFWDCRGSHEEDHRSSGVSGTMPNFWLTRYLFDVIIWRMMIQRDESLKAHQTLIILRAK